MIEPLAHSDLTKKIIGASYEVYNELGFGFLESVYQKSLMVLLKQEGLDAEIEVSVDVFFRSEQVGHFMADLIVDKRVIVELKSIRSLLEIHEVQLVNYLNATGIDIGLLINFGPQGVEVKRKMRVLPE